MGSMGKFLICCRIQLKFCFRVRLNLQIIEMCLSLIERHVTKPSSKIRLHWDMRRTVVAKHFMHKHVQPPVFVICILNGICLYSNTYQTRPRWLSGRAFSCGWRRRSRIRARRGHTKYFKIGSNILITTGSSVS